MQTTANRTENRSNDPVFEGKKSNLSSVKSHKKTTGLIKLLYTSFESEKFIFKYEPGGWWQSKSGLNQYKGIPFTYNGQSDF